MAKSKYEEWLTRDGLLLIAAWARDGLTYEQIAGNCGVADSTFREWKDKYPAIAAALKITRELADIEVENALYKRAMGYDYVETVEEISESKGRTVRTIVKHVSPDVTAQIFWLKNRRPEAWRDRKEQQVQDDNKDASGVVEVTAIVPDGEGVIQQ